LCHHFFKCSLDHPPQLTIVCARRMRMVCSDFPCCSCFPMCFAAAPVRGASSPVRAASAQRSPRGSAGFQPKLMRQARAAFHGYRLLFFEWRGATPELRSELPAFTCSSSSGPSVGTSSSEPCTKISSLELRQMPFGLESAWQCSRSSEALRESSSTSLTRTGAYVDRWDWLAQHFSLKYLVWLVVVLFICGVALFQH